MAYHVGYPTRIHVIMSGDNVSMTFGRRIGYHSSPPLPNRSETGQKRVVSRTAAADIELLGPAGQRQLMPRSIITLRQQQTNFPEWIDQKWFASVSSPISVCKTLIPMAESIAAGSRRTRLPPLQPPRPPLVDEVGVNVMLLLTQLA